MFVRHDRASRSSSSTPRQTRCVGGKIYYVSSGNLEQAIQRLADAATSLTLDQRLRIAALLAHPIEAATAPHAGDSSRSSNTPTESLVLTVEETADLLKVGRTTVYDLLRSGQLNSIMIGRLRRVRHTELIAYLDRIAPD